MSRPVLSAEELFSRLLKQEVGFRSQYRACYMSWVDAIVTEPRMMMISLDDHMVHRGDGVFEAIKAVHGKPYLLQEHLERLARSAELIALPLPFSLKEISDLVKETLNVSKLEFAIIRIFVSRGGGSFGPNPYDSKKSELAIIATELKPIAKEKYQTGVKIGKSQILPKPEFWARIKSCNYLPNVMMKKESVDRGLDFTVSFDEQGFLGESSTENIIIVDENGRLCRPPLNRILKGCTMTRVMDLASEQKIVEVIERPISEQDILKSKEVMMVGTTLDVLSVSEFEGKKIGAGQAGAVARKLNEILLRDQL
jgi:branched-chain amino acid aminotransferase